MWLTPAERRGALVLVAILLLGTAWDVWRSSHPARHAAGFLPARSAALDSSQTHTPSTPAANELRDSIRLTLDLNRATAAALDGLPGIGPVLAGRIVERRLRAGPYRRAEDLLEVPGIGPRLLDRLRPLVTVGADSVASSAMQSAQRSRNGRADSPSARDSAFR